MNNCKHKMENGRNYILKTGNRDFYFEVSILQDLNLTTSGWKENELSDCCDDVSTDGLSLLEHPRQGMELIFLWATMITKYNLKGIDLYLEINLLEAIKLLFECQVAYTEMETPHTMLGEHLIGHLEITKFCPRGRSKIEKQKFLFILFCHHFINSQPYLLAFIHCFYGYSWVRDIHSCPHGSDHLSW